MRSSSIVLLLFPAALAEIQVPTTCLDDIWPPHGTTGVDPNVTIAVALSSDLNLDNDSIRLIEQSTATAVDVSVTPDARGRNVVVTPTQPLSEGRWRVQRLGTGRRCGSKRTDGGGFAEFTVGGDPTPLYVARPVLGVEPLHLELALSEPFELSSLEDYLDVRIGTEWWPVNESGAIELDLDDPRGSVAWDVWIEVPDGVDAVRLRAGAATIRGPALTDDWTFEFPESWPDRQWVVVDGEPVRFNSRSDTDSLQALCR